MNKVDKSPFETSEFKSLELEWTKKLKESGLKTMEAASDKKRNSIRKQEGKIDPNVSQYNRICWDLVNSGKIKNRLDLFILEQHADGMSTREIADLIKSKKMRARFNSYKSISHMSVFRRLMIMFKVNDIKYIGFDK